MNLEQATRSPNFRGRREFTRHLHGKRLTYKQMVIAKCFECMSAYADGRDDCRIHDCPLYPAMPYQTPRPRLDSGSAKTSTASTRTRLDHHTVADGHDWESREAKNALDEQRRRPLPYPSTEHAPHD